MNKLILLLSIVFTGITYSQSFDTFFDDFNSNQNNWLVSVNKDQASKIESGYFYLEGKQKKSDIGSTRELIVDANVNYSFETSIMLEKGPSNMGFGFLIGFQDWQNYSRVLISDDGSASIYQRRNGKGKNVMSWTKLNKGVIKGKGQFNNIKLENKSNRITLYINGQNVFETNKINFVGINHGFMVSDKQKVKIDYYRIIYLKKEINVVQDATQSNQIENLGSNINTKYTEQGPVISADGKTLYFTVKNNPNQYVGNYKNTDIAVSKMDPNGIWSKRELLPYPINNKSKNFLVSILPDENTVLLGNAYKSDGSMGKGVSYGIRRNGEWLMPTPLNVQSLNNQNKYVNYFLSADGGHLLMAIEHDDTKGGLDLYVSFKQGNGTWGMPKNMGSNLNTFADDFSPYLATDGKTLFFASEGHGGYGRADIFMSKRIDETWLNWTKPVNLGPGVNTDKWDAYFKIDARGEYGYMVSSGKNSMGDTDIFRIKLGPGTQPDALELVSGKVYNALTNELLDAQIEYEDLHSGMKMGTAYSTKENGFKIALPKGYKYGFQAKLPGFMPIANNLDLKDLSNYNEKTIDLYMVPVQSGQDFSLQNIFFDGNTSNLSASSFLELDRLVAMLNANPGVKIEINSDMINGGNSTLDISVLQGRIRAIQNYLGQKNVELSRIKMNLEQVKFKPSLEINQTGEIRIKLF